MSSAVRFEMAHSAQQRTVFVVAPAGDERRALLRLLASAGLNVEAHSSPAGFLDACSPVSTGCLILDADASRSEELDLLDQMRARGIRVPTIVLAHRGTVSTAVRAMKAGAVDFIERPFTSRYLLVRVNTALRWYAESRSGHAGRFQAAKRPVEIMNR